MKKLLLMIGLFGILIGCQNEEDKPIGSSVEMYDVLMFVTNDANEDLVENSDKYYHTLEKFRFESWKIYLDGKLIQTGDNDNKYYERNVNYLQYNTIRKNIHLSSNLAIQKRINDYSEKHVAKYVVSSLSLFGDTEEHVIRMEFRCIENEFGFYALKEYFIFVDDIKQEVYYPEDWKDLFPKSQFEGIIFPYFILNVDALWQTA